MGRHYDYSQIFSLPFMGDKWFIEPWDVQWLGDVAAFYFATGVGVGWYHCGPVASIDCGRDAGDGKYVISCTVAALSVTTILPGTFGGYGRSIDAPLILRDGTGMH